MSEMKLGDNGVFITLEGADGLGKSTLYNGIINSLRQKGFKISTFDYPRKEGTPIGVLIGDFLKGKYGEVMPEFLALAFAIDRMDSKTEIRQCLDRGEAVFSDRYVQSNIAYQATKLDDKNRVEELVSLIEWLEFDVFKLPRPDFEIILTAPDSHYTSGDYLKRGDDNSRNYLDNPQEGDIHEMQKELQVRVNNNYRTLPHKEGRFIVDIYHTDQSTRKSRGELLQEVLSLLNH